MGYFTEFLVYACRFEQKRAEPLFIHANLRFVGRQRTHHFFMVMDLCLQLLVLITQTFAACEIRTFDRHLCSPDRATLGQYGRR